MKVYDDVLDLVGHTPLVRLNRLPGAGAATVYAKLEQLNPGGSVKDRMAVNMVLRAEESGLIGPGATLVESTSGNTGLGLAMAAAVRGYHCVCTMPDKMSKEKIDMLKAFGAKVVVTRTDLPHEHPDNYVQVAKRIARETPGAFYTDQYYNPANPEAHYLTTGPEIWEDTDGTIDCLVGGSAPAAQSPAPRSTARSAARKRAVNCAWCVRTRSAASTGTCTTRAKRRNPGSIGWRGLDTISWSAPWILR